MNFYWYISGQEVDMLYQNLAKNWWESFPLKLSFKTPWFDIDSSKANADAQTIKNLQNVVKKIEKKGALLTFENIEQEVPLFFSFQGAGIKVVEDDMVLVAIVQQKSVLLLTGAAANLVGARVGTVKLRESNTLMKSLKSGWSEEEGIADGTVNEIITTLLKQASDHVFPTIKGMATFTTKMKTQTSAFKKIKRPEIEAIVLGNPLYIEQVAV